MTTTPNRAAHCGNSSAQEEAAARAALPGATPSNTAPPTCIPLIHGIDSLYLSAPGQLSDEASARLKHAQAMALSDDPLNTSKAIIEVDDHVLEVAPFRSGPFAFRISDHRFHAKLSSAASKKLPLIYGQLASKFLTLFGVDEAVQQFTDLARGLGEVEGDLNVSRADLFVDFIYPPGIADIERKQWVCRAKDITNYHQGNQFSGWTIGQGGVISARLYDKTLEIQKSGKDYLKTLWYETGQWQPHQTVYRLEFQMRGEALREFEASKWAQFSRKQSELWHYLTEHWLRLCIPNEGDSTPSRWPLHPLWPALIDHVWTPARPASRRKVEVGRIPQDETLSRMYAGVLSSSMAVHRNADIQAARDELHAMAESYYDAKHTFDAGLTFEEVLIGKAREKAKKFGQPFEETLEQVREEQNQVVAREYKKRSGK